ncbi:DUF1716 domain protein [Microthyrium microscopicum]|uniref:DUF1716 domain protein n=1 Tax=Microthyrium microscopicum TaxID=703497 RepID=A0A6A6U663_9PEZI|nr:DUF1716 domain protein [Microthyrium microscopicum]
MEAGPAPPPDDEDENYGPGDDEDGRFFGGGVDQDGKAALDFIDAKDAEETHVEEKYDMAWLRKFALAFEKKISKNSELRAKFEEDPTKFMGSEADLDTSVKELSILSEHPELYEEFANLGCVASLVSLIAHENPDIAIEAIQIINELIDEDVDASEAQWNAVVNTAIDADMLNLLVENFARLNESDEIDRGGIYNSLSIIESLASQPALVTTIGKDTKILPWLLKRIQAPETAPSQNKLYAGELLSILVQSNTPNRLALIPLDAVDTLLQLLAPYRRADQARDLADEELVANLFDALTCLVAEPAGKTAFVKAEGIELALLLVRSDHAASGAGSLEVCERIVEAQGLKALFGPFMKTPVTDTRILPHLLSAFAGLLRALPGDSAERIRLLAKFVEKDYEKIARLVEVRSGLAPKLRLVAEQITAERKELNAEEQEEREPVWLSQRLDAGLYSLQTLDIVLAWLIAEDAGAKRKTVQLLADRDEGLGDIKSTLQEQLSGVVDTDEESISFKEMLDILIDMLN